MKTKVVILFSLLVFYGISAAQNITDVSTESLKGLLISSKKDTTRIKIISELCNRYKFNKPDSSIFYGKMGLELAEKINSKMDEVVILHNISIAYITVGNDSRALQMTLHGIKIADRESFLYDKGRLLLDLATIKSNSEDYQSSIKFLRESKELFDKSGSDRFSTIAEIRLARTFSIINQLDSALYYGKSGNRKAEEWEVAFSELALGEIYVKKGDLNQALSNYRMSLGLAKSDDGKCNANYAIAKVFQKTGLVDSSILYAQNSLELAKENGLSSHIINSYRILSELFEKKDLKKALEYNKSAFAAKEILDKLRTKTALEAFVDYDDQERQYELESAKADYNNKLRQNIFLGSSLILMLIAFFLYRNNRQKQKAKQKIVIAYDQLKSTQAQLIQSEKMASLGELTAGIAHEIQNPLNFVNNFSEVTEELVEELEEEGNKENGERDKGLEKELISDIKENLKKIHHHGNRASSIVKGMLEHSRSSSGIKELTDINALADEYLRLAYHGLRAKDNDFNAEMLTNFDPNLPKIEVVPQDIGRVLLNLINNAFQACIERSSDTRTEPVEVPLSTSENDNVTSRALRLSSVDSSVTSPYKPTVTISTSQELTAKSQKQIAITIKDNGSGIPDEIKDKIFQPFFTTKETGKGTGLGLSLAYDIVKAHGGELKVESEEGKGSKFQILLPIN